MKKSYTLKSEDFKQLFEDYHLLNNLSSQWPAFSDQFFIAYHEQYPDKKNFLVEITSSINYAHTSLICEKIIQNFSNKVNVPEDWSILLLFKNHVGNLGNSMQQKILDFFESKVGKEGLLEMTQNALFHFNEPGARVNRWFELAQSYPHLIDKEKTNKIINQHISLHANYNSSTTDKVRAVKFLSFLNNIEDQSQNIVNFLQIHQKDALFIKRAQNILQKEKINLPQWNQNQIPISDKKEIKCTIPLNPEHFIQNHGFSRKSAETYIDQFISFMGKSGGHFRPSIQEERSLIISTSNLEDYIKSQEIADKAIDNLSKLAPYWNKLSKEQSLSFFENFLNKVDILENLENNLSKKSLIQRKIKL